MTGDTFVIIDRDDVKEVLREDGEIVSVTLAVADGPFDDPHEADFEARDKWSHEIVGIDD